MLANVLGILLMKVVLGAVRSDYCGCWVVGAAALHDGENKKTARVAR
jgi:hypothetical protein